MGLQSCDRTCFWIVEVVMVLVILLFAFYVRSDLLSRVNQGKPVESDISWNNENTLLYPCYAIVAGLVAGLFGIGGGIIKGPLMLSLGVHPGVARGHFFHNSLVYDIISYSLGDIVQAYT